MLEHHGAIVDVLWANMIELYPSVETVRDGITIVDRDGVVRNTSAEILKTLPEPYDVVEVKTFYGDRCSAPSIIVLLQELDKFNALVEVMRNTLTQLAEVGNPPNRFLFRIR